MESLCSLTFAAFVYEKLINICLDMLSAGAGGSDRRTVGLCFCWAAGQDFLLGAPPGGHFVKSSDEEDQRDDSKVAAIDEELREAKKTTINQIYTVGGGAYIFVVMGN